MNLWYSSMPAAPLQQEKIWDLQHPEGYRDAETIDRVVYDRKGMPKGSDRGKRAAALRIAGIVVAAAVVCGAFLWIVKAF